MVGSYEFLRIGLCLTDFSGQVIVAKIPLETTKHALASKEIKGENLAEELERAIVEAVKKAVDVSVVRALLQQVKDAKQEEGE